MDITTEQLALEKQVQPPKTRAGKKFIEDRSPKLLENDKKTMFVKGPSSSGIVNDVLHDLYKIRRQHAIMMNKTNQIYPFEDEGKLEHMSRKADASLFVIGSHSKKRPHNVVFGRMYDAHVLDMIEFGVMEFKKLSDFKPSKVALGSKPCILFNGDKWEAESDWGLIQNYFCDFFCTTAISSINLQGLEYVISISAAEDMVYLRSYEVTLKKSGTDKPYVHLEEIGVSLNLKLRRSKFAPYQTRKEALRVPKANKINKTKNISYDMAGTKLGNIHMTKQDMQEVPQAKMKGASRADRTSTKEKKKRKERKEGKENTELESVAMEGVAEAEESIMEMDD